MIVFHRESGLRFIIYADDHGPPHVHVRGDGEIKMLLSGRDGEPEIVWRIGMKRADAKRARQIVREQKAYLLACWRKLHGQDDSE